MLDFFGHPYRHPLAECYFSQAPIRYGDYIAKLGVFPVSPALESIRGERFEPEGENGLRKAMENYFNAQSAEFEKRVQLCTDLTRMPVENANTEWPESESPYQPVALLHFAVQNPYTEARRQYIDEQLLFWPAHSLAAHRPLGSIMRARMQVCEVMAMHAAMRMAVRWSNPGASTKVPV